MTQIDGEAGSSKKRRQKRQITIDLPEDFLTLCNDDGALPQAVIGGFIADLCSIENGGSDPRAGGYSSNGSDESFMARAYYERVGWPSRNQ